MGGEKRSVHFRLALKWPVFYHAAYFPTGKPSRLRPCVGYPHLCMHIPPLRRTFTAGFVSLFATEFFLVAAIYLVYFGIAILFLQKVSQLSGRPPEWGLTLIPIGLCFLLSACWYAIRRCMGRPGSELSLFGTTHLLVAAGCILVPNLLMVAAIFSWWMRHAAPTPAAP